MNAELVWVTPETDKLVAYMARVSNPKATKDTPFKKLIGYLIGHKHWSPFEMACMCVSIETTRDIARQILRHRSFHFQEFSQRYAVVDEEPEFADARLQDETNRQNSLPTEDEAISFAWAWFQGYVWEVCWAAYQACLHLGIAKELARKLLPEGLTRSKLYMQGTIRDWLHYINIRTGPETQYEHRIIAWKLREILNECCPEIVAAAWQAGTFSTPSDPGETGATSVGVDL